MNAVDGPLSAAKPISLFRAGPSRPHNQTDSRMLVLLRCVLALSAFSIVAAPSAGRTFDIWLYGPLAVYCIFSIVVAIEWARRDWPDTPRLMHWADVLFYIDFFAMLGTGQIYFILFFFYPVLVASFSWGFREGVLVTLVSTVLYATLGLVEGISHAEDVLIAATGLMVFGYVLSYLGVYEHQFRNRLRLLKEINSPWNPRFGVDYVNSVNLELLRNFYDASSCVLMLRRRNSPADYVMYTVNKSKSARTNSPGKVGGEVFEALMRLPDSLGAYYHDPEGEWWMRYRGYAGFDFDLGVKTKAFESECAAWMNLLDTKAFVTVPYSHDATTGRLFLMMDDGWFSQADIEFMAQAADTMATVSENISLIEELVSRAAESERLAMLRDLHDSTIQPYIGLKLALDGLYREAGEQNSLAPRIADLVEMADFTIRDLRNYAKNLKDNSPMAGEFLMDAVAKQAERLRRFYGIEVSIRSEISVELKGKVAAEAFHIIAEGLSNVLRHTSAKNAFVNVRCEESCLLLEIGNEVDAAPTDFMPRSIKERVAANGGQVIVEPRSDQHTIVHVTLPM